MYLIENKGKWKTFSTTRQSYAKEMNRVILTLTYNYHSKAITDIVEKNFHMLNLDEEVGYLFQDEPFEFCTVGTGT